MSVSRGPQELRSNCWGGEGSVLLAGVGGQGVLLASDVLAAVCLGQGLDVKKSEIHGMAQRGGIVYSHVRYGPAVHSPVIEVGRADAVVALEWAEALRWTRFLRPGGILIADTSQIIPPVACADRAGWTSRYPGGGAPLHDDGHTVYLLNAHALAKAAGVARAANVVLLGVLSTRLGFPLEAWEQAIRAHVPAGAADANMRAFAAGREVEPSPPPSADRRLTSAAAPPAARQHYAVDVIDAWCKGCDICVRVCPEDCLRVDPSAGVVRVTDANRCTGCRLCEVLCPDFAITVRDRLPAVTYG